MLDLALFAPTYRKVGAYGKVGALLLPRRKLTPTLLLKNCPLAAWHHTCPPEKKIAGSNPTENRPKFVILTLTPVRSDHHQQRSVGFSGHPSDHAEIWLLRLQAGKQGDQIYFTVAKSIPIVYATSVIFTKTKQSSNRRKFAQSGHLDSRG
jgi:hypothetical protein